MDFLTLDQEALKTLAERVYERLRNAILIGEISAGERISERDIARQMGTSTSPIKRALNQLQMEGLVEIKPRKGTFVTNYTETELSDVAEIRAALEGLAARFAARYATEDEIEVLRGQILIMKELTDKKKISELAEANTRFHQMIRDFGRNSFISQLVRTFHFYRNTQETGESPLPDILIRPFSVGQEHLLRGFLEHKAVFEAIAKRDSDLAERRIKEHIIRPYTFDLRDFDNSTAATS